MKEQMRHPTEAELLLTAEGEPGGFEAARVRTHLAECRACRARQREMQQASEELAVTRHDQFEGILPSHAAARARLESRLRQVNASSRWTRLFQPRMIRAGKLTYALATCFFLFGVLSITSQQVRKATKTDIPRASLTPGDAVLQSSRDVCMSPAALIETAIPPSLQDAVLREYGINHTKQQDYELDYLITPQLGGATSLRNLWPEPYSAKWNAHVKDQLETRLHEMVCSGSIDLATAQHDIASNWVAAYRRYFHTSEPLPVR